MKKILAATGNKGKLKEFRELLEPMGYEVLSLKDFDQIPEVIEDADTFSGNAQKKASEIAKALNIACFADDSGLCVDALDGRPGVHSARYGGEDMNHADKCQKLLCELEGCEDRSAGFVCAIALANTEGKILGVAEASCEGRILMAPSGDGGFGYDPIFAPRDYDKSFAELGTEIKNSLSHRAKALNKAVASSLFS